MTIPNEEIQVAKSIYGEEAIDEIVEYFNIENFDTKNKKGSCPFGHVDKTPSFIWNSKANSFHCFSCNKNYDIIDLYMDKGMTFLQAVENLFNKETVKKYFAENGMKVPGFEERGLKNKKNYHYPVHEQSKDRSLVENYLGLRKISKQTLDYADVQQDAHGNIAFHYYDSNDVLLTVKYRPSHKIDKEKGENKCFCQSNADTSPVLFNMNRIVPDKPLVITEGECYNGNTEVLTPNGWVKLKNYNGEDVLQVDVDMSASFVKPLAYVKKYYSGNMFSVRNNKFYAVDVTKGHNMIYYDKNERLIVEEAKEFRGTKYGGYIPTAVAVYGKGIRLTNKQLSLIIALNSDCITKVGHYEGQSRIAVRYGEKLDRLISLLDYFEIKYQSPYKYKTDKYKYLIFDTPLWADYDELPYSWISEASQSQREFIIKEMLYWDGKYTDGANTGLYHTTKRKSIVLFQILAHTFGHYVKIKRDGLKRFSGTIQFDKIGVPLPKGFTTKKKYNGMVYCVTVPTHMLLIRFDNKISVCGNCDTLSVIEAGYKNVVSIPFGAGSHTWIDYNWDWLEQFDKIIVWSDDDEAGERMRKEVCPRLGNWRTSYIKPNLSSPKGTKKLKDANEILYYYGKDKILELIQNPMEMPVEGIINLANVTRFDIEKAQGLYSGIKPLDKKLYKFIFGTVCIITGKAGEGKSVLANQIAICQALQQGYDTFVFSGELPAPNLKDWIETNLIGREYITMKDEHIRYFDEQARLEVVKWYNGRIWMFDDSQGTTATMLLQKMEEMARRFGTKVFLIDNLMMVDLECDSNSLLQAQKEFVKKLVKFAKTFDVLVFLVAHPKKTGAVSLTSEDVSGSQDIVNLGHYLISVHRYTDEEKEGVKGKNGDFLRGYEPKMADSVIRVLKNRITGSQNFNVELYFDVPSYRFYTDTQELWFRYKWNKSRKPIPTTDPNRRDESPL